MALKTHPEFESLLDSMSEQEFSQLEANCLSAGRINDSIDIWRDWIVDGHNRYKIATKHSLNYDVRAHTFADEEEAKQWIINNQLGRRNLSPQRASYFRGKLLENVESQQGKTTSPQNEEKSKTTVRKEVAKKTGVSKSTLERDEQLAKAVDKLTDGLKRRHLAGELGATREEVIALANKPKDKQAEIARDVRVGNKATFTEALGVKKRAAKKKTPKKAPGTEVKKATEAMGVVVRFLHGRGLKDKHEKCLSAILKEIKP